MTVINCTPLRSITNINPEGTLVIKHPEHFFGALLEFSPMFFVRLKSFLIMGTLFKSEAY